MNKTNEKQAIKVISSHRKKRVEFTRKVKKGNIIKGTSYYLDNRLVLLNNATKNPGIDDCFMVVYPPKGKNKIPKSNGRPIPPIEQLNVTWHGQLRSRERNIMSNEIYEAIVHGIESDQSDASTNRMKYLRNDIVVVVVWKKNGLIVTEMSVAPSKRMGFLEKIPLMFAELEEQGMKEGLFMIFDKMTHLENLSMNIGLSQLTHRAAWLALMDEYGILPPELKQEKEALVKMIGQMQDNHVVYEYCMVRGLVKHKGTQTDRVYAGGILCREVTLSQRTVLEKWGLFIEKSDTKTGAAVLPAGEGVAYIWDMNEFCGNSHDWSVSIKNCKLSKMAV